MLYERSPRNNIVRSPWAIKKLNKRISVKSEYAKRLEEEAEILRKLQHPNIIGYRGMNWLAGLKTNTHSKYLVLLSRLETWYLFYFQ